jgi:hypothetical protein
MLTQEERHLFLGVQTRNAFGQAEGLTPRMGGSRKPRENG